MPGWGEILKELQVEQAKKNAFPFDTVRRKYVQLLSEYTNRRTILYATQWTQPGAPAELVTITHDDIVGLMEVVRENAGGALDLVLHTPGGSPEATEAIVTYLRSKYPDDIRVIVPHAAMSAGTMLACAANRIMMGRHSFLGPIDPQMIMRTQLGPQAMPAHAILDQFDLGKEECKDPNNLGPWLPILSQYGPSLLVQCENAIALSRDLVGSWLRSYMFRGSKDAARKARRIAKKLSDHTRFLSHGRHISREDAKVLGLVIDDLEEDQRLQDLVLSVYHATSHTLSGTNAVKIIENQMGRAFIKAQRGAAVPPTAPGP